VKNINPKCEESLGCHFTCDFTACAPNNYFDKSSVYIERLLTNAALAAGFDVLATAGHQFQPQGVSGALVLGESHICWHTWPEKAAMSLDVYSCTPTAANEVKILNFIKFVEGLFLPKYNHILVIYR
jgi:S-adenosylmethionine decarboxylase